MCCLQIFFFLVKIKFLPTVPSKIKNITPQYCSPVTLFAILCIICIIFLFIIHHTQLFVLCIYMRIFKKEIINSISCVETRVS